MFSSSLILILLAACTGEPADTSSTGGDDTGETGGDDTDGDSAADSGDTGGDTGPADNLGFVIDGPFEGTTLSLTWVDPSTLGGENLAFGAILTSAPVTGATTTIYAEAPGSAELVEINPEDAPGLLMAMYVPALHVDEDGDGLPNGAETYAGVAMTWAVYVGGVIPEQFTALGVVEGWNAFLAAKQEQPVFSDAMAIPITASLQPSLDVALGGDLDFDPDGVRLMLISGQTFSGESTVGALVDQALSDPWSLTLSGPPSAERFYDITELGVRGALEVPLTYADLDGSETFDETADQPLYGACHQGVPVALLWLPPPTSLSDAFSLTQLGAGSGWLALEMGGSGGVVDAAALTALSIDDSCGLGGA